LSAIGLAGFVIFCSLVGCASSLDESTVVGELGDKLPNGWILRGRGDTEPGHYQGAIDGSVRREGDRSACIMSMTAAKKDAASMHQRVRAEQYHGKRIRFSAYIKTNKVSGWLGLWMRIDSDVKQGLAFDNMIDRPIRGTSEWRRYDVVLDVPDQALLVSYGMFLNGRGQAWFDDCSLEVVDKSVRSTDLRVFPGGIDRIYPIPAEIHQRPTNLGFEV
jgi:hypothetical protein